MSLPLLHAGRTNPGLSPQLDLRFAIDKSLTAYRGPTPSFSRASTGTYFNSSGVLTSAAINAPRFDHTFNGTSWVSRGLLVEEQRTNICLQSNTFNTTWLTLNGTVTANAATSPDGTNNAWKLNETSANSASHGIYQQLTIGTGNYTWSVYAKAGERSWLQFIAYSSSTNYFTWFNLANGTVGTNAAGTTASIQDVGGGWYRCSVSRSTSAGTSYAQIFTANADNNGSYAGDPTKGIYIYGCQVEAGSFPTSYIGTTTSSVTRSADVCQITGTNFSGFWNGTEGTVAAEFDFFFSGAGWNPSAWTALTSSTNFLQQYRSGATDLRFFVYPGSVQADFSIGSYANPSKTTVAYKANDFAGSANGAAVATDTLGTVPAVDKLYIMAGETGNIFSGHIASLRYYNKRLPNTKLQQLST